MMLLMMCSCAGKEKNVSEKQDEPLREFTALNEVVDGRKDIYLITKVIDSNYWNVLVEGARSAGDAFGCNVYFSGTNNEMDWENQLKLLDQAVSLGADAIILAPDDSIELASKIEEIYSSGIPVILVDTIANTDSFDICYMTDNLEAGNKAAKEMIEKLSDMGFSEDEELTVGILVGSGTSQTINERLAGFYQYWTDNAPDSWIIIKDIQNCNGDMELGADLTASLLKEHKDLHGLFATNNGPTKVIANTVAEKGCNDVVVVGFDYSDEISKLISSPDYHASTILQRQYYMSYQGVETALEILDGNQTSIKFEDTGVIVVNHDNLTDPEVQALIEVN